MGDGEEVGVSGGKGGRLRVGGEMMEGERKSVSWRGSNGDGRRKRGC